METVAIGAQVLLAAIFLTAGVAKLLDQAGARQALVDFGIPNRAVPAVALLLPLAEIAVAALVLIHPTTRIGAAGAFILLGLFIVAISNAMRRGRAPDCHCFGQLQSSPAGRSTLVRNAVLAGVAAFLVVYPGEGISAWVDGRSTGALVAIGVGIAALCAAAVAARLLRDNRALRDELATSKEAESARPLGLPVGALAPTFTLPTVRGETVTLGALCARGNPVALMFISPGCDPCKLVLPDFRRWQATLAERLTFAFISTGSAADNRLLLDQFGLLDVLLQDQWEVAEEYRPLGSPAAVIVTPERTIGSPLASGRFQIQQLIRMALSKTAVAAPESTASYLALSAQAETTPS